VEPSVLIFIKVEIVGIDKNQWKKNQRMQVVILDLANI